MSIGAALRRMGHVTGQLDTSRPYITMFDSITVSVLPSGGSYAYAGYTGGLWPTFKSLQARFPGHRLLSIAVFASDNADCLDIEKGDATIDEAPGWYERQVHRGVWRPAMYIQASNMRALEREMAAAHIARADYRLISAHYLHKAHLCSPKSCGYGQSEADATQWTDRALGINLDQSILLPNFFDARPVPPKPAPKPVPAPPKPVPAPVPDTSWQETMLNALPTLKQGDKDVPGKVAFVGRMQSLIKYIGQVNNLEAAKDLTVDGDFGIHSTNALLTVQSFFGLKADRLCGPQTWRVLVTGEK